MDNGDFCRTYSPVPTLEVGTDMQKERVDKNNAVYLERKCDERT